jgi:hypothetical protein
MHVLINVETSDFWYSDIIRNVCIYENFFLHDLQQQISASLHEFKGSKKYLFVLFEGE